MAVCAEGVQRLVKRVLGAVAALAHKQPLNPVFMCVEHPAAAAAVGWVGTQAKTAKHSATWRLQAVAGLHACWNAPLAGLAKKVQVSRKHNAIDAAVA
jgi:RsiW-degrading membrane proteinase PrsW (M82 family)